MVKLDGKLSFWAAGQDPSYASEVFAVYASTDKENWDLLSEDITATGEMTEYTFDLTSYEGVDGYVAIRHYNVSDMFRLNVDDIAITYVEPSEWIDVNGLDATSYTIEGLKPDTNYEVQVQAVNEKNQTSSWTEPVVFTPNPSLLILANDGDNSQVIAEMATATEPVDVVLQDRTLYKDNGWNTLCLPFNVTIAGSVLDGDGVEAKAVESASVNGSTLNLTFGDAVDELLAGVPYIIKWSSAANIENPQFNNVTFSNVHNDYDNGEENGDARVRFIGTYATKVFEAENQNILLMGAENKLYYPDGTSASQAHAFHAYFMIGGDSGRAPLDEPACMTWLRPGWLSSSS